jgi:hypothetical protein
MKSRSLLVQIRPPQSKNLFYQQLPRTIRIDNFEFQSDASERTADDKLRQIKVPSCSSLARDTRNGAKTPERQRTPRASTLRPAPDLPAGARASPEPGSIPSDRESQWFLLSCSLASGSMYANLANGGAGNNFARASPIHTSVACSCADREFAKTTAKVFVNGLSPSTPELSSGRLGIYIAVICFFTPISDSLPCPERQNAAQSCPPPQRALLRSG